MPGIWDNVAPGWEASADFVDTQLALATSMLLDAAGVTEGDAVLDLACGPGGAGLAAAARLGAGGTVLLSDAAPEMVAVAARRAKSDARVSTALFEQSAIPAPDEYFDAVIVRHGLMFVEDDAGAVREAARVLRAGGHYAAMTWGPREQNPWLGLTLDAVGEQFGVPFPPPSVRGPFSLSNAELLKDVLRKGGLEDVEVQSCEAPMPAASLQAWWERVLQLAGPLSSALDGMEPDVREAIKQRALVAGERAALHEGDQLVFGGSVLIAAGVAPRA